MEINLGYAVGGGKIADVVVGGPRLQLQYNEGAIFSNSTIVVPGTIAGSGTWTSPVLPSFGMPHQAISAELTNAGSIVLNRFIDSVGSVANGASATAALTAGTVGILDNSSTLAFQSFSISVINGSSSVGTLSNIVILGMGA